MTGDSSENMFDILSSEIPGAKSKAVLSRLGNDIADALRGKKITDEQAVELNAMIEDRKEALAGK